MIKILGLEKLISCILYIGEGPIKKQFEGFSENKEQCFEFIPDPPTVR